MSVLDNVTVSRPLLKAGLPSAGPRTSAGPHGPRLSPGPPYAPGCLCCGLCWHMLALSESESNKSMPSLSCLRVHLASLPRTTLHVGGTDRLAPPTLPHLAYRPSICRRWSRPRRLWPIFRAACRHAASAFKWPTYRGRMPSAGCPLPVHVTHFLRAQPEACHS